VVGFHKDDPKEGQNVTSNDAERPARLHSADGDSATYFEGLARRLARPRGFPRALCPRCMDDGNLVRVDLDDLANFTCDCGGEFCVEDVLQLMREWGAVLEYLALAPPTEGQP
jgi:hypothetical protein